MRKEFVPKLVTLLKQGISKETLTKDFLSGLIVGIVALPLAISFAIASGVSPEKGILTAIIAGIVISILGGSRVQIGGPTGAFIVIIYAIVQQYGTDGLIIATFMAGFIMIGSGLARLGNLLKFIPYSLVVGFTSGIALIIFSSQINDFLGLSIGQVPADFIDKWAVYFDNLHNINWYAISIAATTVIITLHFQKIIKKIPGSIIAIVLATIFVQVFEIPVDTIESNFGNIPNSLGLPSIPNVSFDTIQALIQPAFAIAILGSIESLLSAVVSDSMIGAKHRSNIELVAQGAANIVSSLFGGIPATGAIARTATNVNNGGRTPIAGIVHALVLLVIMLLFAPYAKLIPMASLAGILMVVAYHMSEWKQFKSILKGNRMDIIILLTTFFLTVIFDLVIAIEIGIVLSSFIFMKRMSQSVQIQDFSKDSENDDHLFEEEHLDLPKGLVLYEINGPLFFGAARQFQETIINTHTAPKVVVIRMRYVPLIDATGYQSLKEIIKTYKAQNINVIISGVRKNLRKDFEKNGMFTFIEDSFVVEEINTAIERVKENL
ncbi:SulP family inorganic anion transporter [Salegentibacter flavus]|uniref:Sulfate permease, SulP family n=1 Tax=Salegentibacter flavus TaxID=287099 RepID=A0A1I5C240_9FLAO|nr:SulP family inorganic anion transporter [Salegentibacter flavus]SFN80912.1 sulfate permease, SulP family [Salegentibacter flavus]